MSHGFFAPFSHRILSYFSLNDQKIYIVKMNRIDVIFSLERCVRLPAQIKIASNRFFSSKNIKSNRVIWGKKQYGTIRRKTTAKKFEEPTERRRQRMGPIHAHFYLFFLFDSLYFIFDKFSGLFFSPFPTQNCANK